MYILFCAAGAVGVFLLVYLSFGTWAGTHVDVFRHGVQFDLTGCYFLRRSVIKVAIIVEVLSQASLVFKNLLSDHHVVGP